jgi:hypothetical protein
MIADLSTSEVRAAASVQMATKRIKYVEIDVRQYAAFSLNESAEMPGGSNIANGTGRWLTTAISGEWSSALAST